MSSKTIHSGILTVLGAVLTVGTSGAANGAVVGQDNFDNISPGNPPSPTVGTLWNDWYTAKVGTGVAVAPSSPNYLNNQRNDGGGIQDHSYYLNLDGAPLAPGTVVHAEMQNYIMEGVTIMSFAESVIPVVGPDDYWTNAIIYLATNATSGGSVDAYGLGYGWKPTGLTWSANVWQLWEIDYTVGASSFTLTVGGNSVVLNNTFMKDSAASQLEFLTVETGGSPVRNLIDNVLVEAVPEPASLGLLGLGALAMLRRRMA